MSIHQLKVTLDTITPLIWRRVHVHTAWTSGASAAESKLPARWRALSA